MLADLAALLVVLGLTAYVVLGGADFGTGIWDLTARDPELRARIKNSMSPVWEANHVWLIFILVVMWTAFPEAFGSIASTLAVPLFLAAVGIILRGTAFALRGEAASMFEQRSLGGIFALSSLLVPFFLGTVVGGIASGRVPVGNAAGDELTSWANETSIMVGVLSIVTGAHLAAVFLGADARRAGQTELVGALRVRALGSGLVAGAVALAGLYRGALGRARALRRAHVRRGARLRAGVGRWPGWARWRSNGAGASRPRATAWRWPWRRSWPGWRRRRSPTCFHPSSPWRRRPRPTPRWWRCSAGPRSASAS